MDKTEVMQLFINRAINLDRDLLKSLESELLPKYKTLPYPYNILDLFGETAITDIEKEKYVEWEAEFDSWLDVWLINIEWVREHLLKKLNLAYFDSRHLMDGSQVRDRTYDPNPKKIIPVSINTKIPPLDSGIALKDYLKRCRRAFENELRTYISSVRQEKGKKTPKKAILKKIDWLVEFHVSRKTYGDISKKHKVPPETIRKSVRELSDLLQIPRITGRRKKGY